MEYFFECLSNINDKIVDFVWVKSGLIILIGTGIIMTCLTKFFQISHLKHWWKNTVGSLFDKKVISHSDERGSISPFQALCTSLAATIGTGNIAGVAAAICIGGAGAVFWMWIAAFFGMMTNYSENVLGIFYRRRNEKGEWSGGAMYYLRDGLGSKKGCKNIGKILSVLFALFTMIAAFGIGNLGQVNKIVANITSAFDIKALSNVTFYGNITLYSLVIGIVLMIIAALIILGGLQRIASFTEKVVPFMVILFILGSILVIGTNYANVLPAFKAIFTNAFKPVAALGGGVGALTKTVITQGFKRGVFSNEAGLGSTVMVNSTSNITEPSKQGMWGIFEVFADTIVVCTMTALVVLTSGVYDIASNTLPKGVTDATLVAASFNSVFSFGNIGEKFIAAAILLFAFTTVIGWSYYGSKATEYLFGTKGVKIYKIFFVLFVSLGGMFTSSLAWDISDTFNGLMMIPNLIGVISLSPLVAKITQNYIDRSIKGKKIKPLLSYDAHIQEQGEKKISFENQMVK